MRRLSFEGQKFSYAAFHVDPQDVELTGILGGPVTTQLTALGSAHFDRATCVADGSYTVSGWLDTPVRAGRLQIEAEGQLRQASTAATFEATFTPATEGGPTFHLVGWVYTEPPAANGGGRVIGIRGTIRETTPGTSGLGTGAFSMRRVPNGH